MLRWGQCLIMALFFLAASGAQAAIDAPVSVYKDQLNSYGGVLVQATFLNDNGQYSGSYGDFQQNTGGLTVRLGAMVDPNFGFETRLGTGLWRDITRYRDGLDVVSTQLQMDFISGAWFTGKFQFLLPFYREVESLFLGDYRMIENFFVQGYAGMSYMEVHREMERCGAVCVDTSRHHDSGDFSWGLGGGARFNVPRIGLPLPPQVGISLDYMDYGTVDNVDVTAVEAGLIIFF